MPEKLLFVRIKGTVLGPFGPEQLRALRDRGQFRRFHEVSEDRNRWVTASTFPELFTTEQPQARVAELKPETSTRPPTVAEPESLVRDYSQSPASPLLPEWHYIDAEQKRRGPVSREMLINLLYNGVIHSSTPVWKTGLSNWIELSSPEAGLIIPMKRPEMSEPAKPDESEAAVKGKQSAEMLQPSEDWQAILGWRRSHMGISLVLLAVFLLLGAILLALFSLTVSSIGKEKGAGFAFVVMILAYLLGFGGQLVETVGYGFCTARSGRGTPKGLAITAFILGVISSVLGACLLILFLTTARVASAKVNPAAADADSGAFVVIWTLAVLVGMAKPIFFLFYLRALAVSLRVRKLARSILNATILYGLAAFLLFFVLFVPLLYPPREAALGAGAVALVLFRIITYGLLLAWFTWYVLVLYQTRSLLAERSPV
jgi:hypothetical protein